MTKEIERESLHKMIWKIANDLRGSVDGWDFKSYVLGFLFYRFISDDLTQFLNKDEGENGDYANLPDKDAEVACTGTVHEKGFFILPSQLFENVHKNGKNNPNLNETLDKVFKAIEQSSKGSASEANFAGLFDDLDINSNKLGSSVQERNAKLLKVMDAINSLNLGNMKDHAIDVFGDAYEYLIGMYASQAGRHGGEFFTPQEVSELLAKLTLHGQYEVNKVYDPCCGSGSLLLKFAKILGRENVRQGFFGQEINPTSYNLCRINMVLHGIGFENFNIAHGDTLTNPKYQDNKPFDAIVSNPPYSSKWEGDSNPVLIDDERFSPAGVLAPKSKADLAFTMHMLHWLSSKGTASIVEFPGVLYRSGAEQKIRQYLIHNNYIDAVIQLPPDLFFSTTIATCIIVLKKNKKDNNVLFIDASKEYVRSGTKNKLAPANIDTIMQAFTKRVSKEHFAALVSMEEIEKKEWNLSVSSYIAPKDTQEVIDITKLNAEIQSIVQRQEILRKSINAIVADLENKQS